MNERVQDSGRAPVFLVDPEAADLVDLGRALEHAGYAVRTFRDGESAWDAAQKEEVLAVVTEYRLEGLGGIPLIERLREAKPLVPVFMVSACADSKAAIRAVQTGAYDFLPKPVDAPEFLELLEEALEGVRKMATRVVIAEDAEEGDPLIGKSRAMAKVYRDLAKLSATPVTVLIRGETGTGKELVARALYQHGHRAHRPYITVNCAAIPEQLLESELFGHEKGAFTGAVSTRIGKFEQAHGATLFLDEIGDMALSLQAKMLRVLQERQIQRVGGREEIPVDVRIIAASHQPLERMVEEGSFRADLFYRLNGAPLYLPPLRDRFGDVELLADFLLRRYGRELGVKAPRIAKDAVRFLTSQSWPGNVRQLQNIIRQALLKRRDFTIGRDDVEELFHPDVGRSGTVEKEGDSLLELARVALEQAKNGQGDGAYRDLQGQMEEVLLQEAMRQSGGNVTQAARWLGVTRYTLREKMKAREAEGALKSR
jgi:DNA-binding NtrC family response regulator